MKWLGYRGLDDQPLANFNTKKGAYEIFQAVETGYRTKALKLLERQYGILLDEKDMNDIITLYEPVSYLAPDIDNNEIYNRENLVAIHENKKFSEKYVKFVFILDLKTDAGCFSCICF